MAPSDPTVMLSAPWTLGLSYVVIEPLVVILPIGGNALTPESPGTV
jgi:hypothetical protein